MKRLQTDKRTERRTDDGQEAIRKAQLRFQLRRADNITSENDQKYMNFPLKRECNTTFDVTCTGLTFS